VVIGYLVWSQFPITVFVEPVTAADHSNPFTAKRAQTWVTAVQKAIQEWTPYLPLQQVENRKKADIAIWRSAPPLRIEPSSGKETGDRSPLPISRARSAETRFELYARRPTSGPPGSPSVLSHRVAVYIRPDQAGDYLQAAARHELGHALGIWGHSPQPTDALYFSQVRNPAKISARDLNTLKRVYEQPTRLGWALAADR
jgi:predicted Zn-dependent protease